MCVTESLGVIPEDQKRTGVLVELKPQLTRREREVLCLMAEGLTAKAIAVKLGVAFKTATCHRAHILQKLRVTSTVSAVRWAIREGLIKA
jgi:two-component system, NarL family, response regulator NreC